MKIYIVRHGESIANAKRIHQHPTTPLSQTGEKQAVLVAKRFANISIDSILSSPHTRAKQTAEKISEVTSVPIEYINLLCEIKRPSELIDIHYDDERALQIKKLLKENRSDPRKRYTDEETFYDAKQRVQELLTYIEKLDKEHIVLVTHGDFLKMILGVMIFEEKLTHDIFAEIERTFSHRNTGVTVCTKTKKFRWVIETFNDVSHLPQ